MAERSKIEWTDATWNPIRARNKATGGIGHFCVHVSRGCERCYAERMQPRFRNPIRYAAQDRSKVDLFLDERMLAAPLRWRAPRRVFVCSMTDLFAEFVSDAWIDQVFAVMALAPRHTFQVLTKRPERMREYLQDEARLGYDVCIAAGKLIRRDPGEAPPWPLPNVWLGVSVEDQETADERIPYLLATPAAGRWVSYEPALGPVDFTRWLGPHSVEYHAKYGRCTCPAIVWIVVGGESGPQARPFMIEWAYRTIEQCCAAGVPCFVKQLGARPICHRSSVVAGLETGLTLSDRKGGDWSEWPDDLRVRQYPDPSSAGGVW